MTHQIIHVETTIPQGITVAEYRVSRPAAPSLRKRLASQLRALTR